MEQAEAAPAGPVGSEICDTCDLRHTCGQSVSTPRVIQSFEVDLEESQSRTCYKKFLIACIMGLLVIILLVIILRSIF